MKKRTFCTTLEGPANALTSNRDANQVAVAGRNVFKIFEINDEQNMFIEMLNLRVGKNLNLNYSCNDVVWSSNDDNVLATAATNGSVVVWNIQKSTRSKIDQVFSHHKRTVNKVCFHPTEGHLLLSGSQDGTMKLFDLRKQNVSVEFNSLSESVRDVQFSPHFEWMFAAVQENGNVQLWDSRRNDKYLRQFTAHNGPVFSCDWHPEDKKWFATAGRDKTIKLWDLSTQSGNPALDHCIQTIASVAKLKWRPQRRTNIASCSLLLDFSIYVWDVMRPFVPFATFMEHKDTTTDFFWRDSPHTIISTGKDGLLFQHSIKDAHRPADHANPCGLDVNTYGDVCHAVSDLISKSNSTNSGAYVSVAIPNNKPNFLSATSAALVHYASGSLRMLKKKSDYSEQFRCCTSSLLYSKNQNTNKALSMDWFVISALRYKLSGRPFNELCTQNAEVAMHLNRPQVAQTWRVINQMFSGTRSGTLSNPPSSSTAGINSSNADEKTLDSSDVRAPSRHTSGSVSGRHLNGNRTASTQTSHPLIGPLHLAPADQTSAQTEEDSDSSDDGAENIFTPMNKSYVRHDEKSLQQNDFFFGDGDVSSSTTLAVPYEVVPNEATAIDDNTQDWDLPREAFQPRHPIQEVQIPPDIDAINTYPSSPTSLDEDDTAVEDSSNAGLLSSIDTISKSLLSTSVAPNPSWKFMDIIVDILHFYAAQGDIQTTISIVIVLGERIKSSVDDALLEFWFHSYIDLLSRFELWNVVSQIICLSPVRNINILNQTSTTVYSNCGNCLKPLTGRVAWICEKCKTSPTMCSVCRGISKGVFVWCQGCSHGGHLQHMQEWFCKHRYCPTGCGHQCQYT